MSQESLLGARRLRALLEAHGVHPAKSLGQNFVIDPNTIRKVVEIAALTKSDRVLEVGAGCGSLTLGLAGAARSVVAVELDRRLIDILAEALDGLANIEIVQGDALEMDLGAFGSSKLVGNLPYNIAATLVVRVLHRFPTIGELTVMTQREVGERLCAPAASKSYGKPSVLVAFYAEAKIMTSVSRRAFFPTPNVDSVVVRVHRRDTPPDVDEDAFIRVVAAAFSQRRKMLRTTLAPLTGPVPASEVLSDVGVDPRSRAEELDWRDFGRIAARLPVLS